MLKELSDLSFFTIENMLSANRYRTFEWSGGRELSVAEDLTIAQADKRNVTAVLNGSEYEKKVDDILGKPPFIMATRKGPGHSKREVSERDTQELT